MTPHILIGFSDELTKLAEKAGDKDKPNRLLRGAGGYAAGQLGGSVIMNRAFGKAEKDIAKAKGIRMSNLGKKSDVAKRKAKIEELRQRAKKTRLRGLKGAAGAGVLGTGIAGYQAYKAYKGE